MAAKKSSPGKKTVAPAGAPVAIVMGSQSDWAIL